MDSFASIGGGSRVFVEEHHRVSRMSEEGFFWGLQISLASVLFATPTWPASSLRHLTDAAVLPVEFWRKPFLRRSAQVTQLQVDVEVLGFSALRPK